MLAIANLFGTTTPATGPGNLYAHYTLYPATMIVLLIIALLLLLLGLLLIWQRRRIAGIILVIVGAIFAGTVWVVNYYQHIPPIVFSERAMLNQLWAAYRDEYVEAGTGRTIDKQRQNITTSEGQAYTMLRAVWSDDKSAFDLAWKFTKNNLQRNDNLFSWLFGELPNGRFGVLTARGGANTASDADVDIALALLFAYSRWQDPNYYAEAMAIIPNIWEQEVVIVNGRPYLAANNIEKTSRSESVLLNPSYFAPYAYRIFATIDGNHPWNDLITTSYEVLNQSVSLPLDRPKSVGLPPDWVTIDRATGALTRSSDNTLTTNFGYDAMRVPWRLALDYRWFNEPRAEEVLKKMEFLSTEWQKNNRLASTYSHDGQKLLDYESPAMYGGTLGFFLLTHPDEATQIYRQKLIFLYDPDSTRWREILSYYDDNLAWFGLALYNNYLVNLYQPH